MNNDMNLEQAFPFISDLDAGLRQEFTNACTLQTIKQGSHLADSGTACRFMTFVLAGCIKIFKLSPEGREITLFRVAPGDCCIMSAACILSGKPFSAMAVAEEAVTAAMIPGMAFADFFSRSTELRRYIMGMFADRFDTMALLVEEVAFNRMDKRLAKFLVQKGHLGQLKTTHEAIAFELGTAREVVSRLLNDFQKKEYVRLSRGAVSIEDPKALSSLSES